MPDKENKLDIDAARLEIDQERVQIERDRLAIEKDRSRHEDESKKINSDFEDRRLKLEERRLGIDEKRVDIDNRFWNRYFGSLITAVLSLAAVIVSAGQVYSTYIAKEKELEITQIQRQSEIEKQNKQRQQEWDLSIAKFVMENRKALLSPDPQEQELFAKVIPIIFPDYTSLPLLKGLENASAEKSKNVWRNARVRVIEQAQQLVSNEEMQQVQLSAKVSQKLRALELTWKDNKGNSVGDAAVTESKAILNRLGVSISSTSTPEEVFASLRNEVQKTVLQQEYVSTIAKAMGIN